MVEHIISTWCKGKERNLKEGQDGRKKWMNC